jgi:7-carboxy-7-deazaguanine synthase (Cx14CxxC type)
VSYAVKEIFLTLQGEGTHAGRPAVFCRFAGCNLWSGLEEHRSTAACSFCDTDFNGLDGSEGGRYLSSNALADAVVRVWGPESAHRAVVLTGGEPLLQVDAHLITALHAHGFWIAVETNGTIAAPAGIDWLCVSPKANALLIQESGDELKLAYPQTALDPDLFAGLSFTSFRLQPIDGNDRDKNTIAAIRYCLAHPQWQLSLQTHKFVGLR